MMVTPEMSYGMTNTVSAHIQNIFKIGRPSLLMHSQNIYRLRSSQVPDFVMK